MADASSYKKKGLRRRRPTFEDEGNAWLITYGDAITLLLAFFVMIMSVSDVNQGKIEMLQEGLAELFNEAKPETPFSEIKETIQSFIDENQMGDNVTVTMDPKGVKVEFSNFSLYSSGSADIRPGAIPMLREVTTAINESSSPTHIIEVEGHTDDVPISSEIYPSNWELSGARASNVVKYLMSQGVDKRRLKATGYADSRPKIDMEDPSMDDTKKRQANRRVVIFVKRYQ